MSTSFRAIDESPPMSSCSCGTWRPKNGQDGVLPVSEKAASTKLEKPWMCWLVWYYAVGSSAARA
jgi:hypothetical protein